MDAAIFTDPQSPIARSLFAQLGFRAARDLAEADLLWIRTGYGPLLSELGAGQTLNHLPAEREVVDKGPLTEHLQRWATSDPARALAVESFYPESYRLYDPEDREHFFSVLPERDDSQQLWILKPDRGSEGEGIRILWRLEDLRSPAHAPDAKPTQDDEQRFVIQRYVKNPLLIGGRKSALRVFVLVASLDPLQVLVYRDGFVRINAAAYRLDDLAPAVHLSNTRQQQSHPQYDPWGQVWSFPQLQSYLGDELGRVGPDFVEQELLASVQRAVECVFRAARDRLCVLPPRGHCFGLYAVDLLLDEALRLWLFEVQVNPGLKHHDPVKRQIIPPLLGETARIALEVRDRSQRGQPLAELDSLERFCWVIGGL